MIKAKNAVQNVTPMHFPSVQEAQHRLTQLGQGLDAVRAAAAEFARLRDAFERVPAIEAEMAAIRAAMPGIERKDFDRHVDAYEIAAITPIDEGKYANALRKYTVHGTYEGRPFEQPLANQSRVLLAAVARRPELIPAEILTRAETPMDALLRNVRDVHRGYRD
jgi:hypothetical protein